MLLHEQKKVRRNVGVNRIEVVIVVAAALRRRIIINGRLSVVYRRETDVLFDVLIDGLTRLQQFATSFDPL